MDRKSAEGAKGWRGVRPVSQALGLSRLSEDWLSRSMMVEEPVGLDKMAQSALEVNWLDLGASRVGAYESLPLNHNICTSETRQEKESLAQFAKLLQNKEQPGFIQALQDATHQYGIPNEHRSQVWLYILFPDADECYMTQRKIRRTEYVELLKKHYGVPETPEDISLQNSINVDIVRTHPPEFYSLYTNPYIQDSLKRVSYVWAKENKHISYFQGLPDLMLPFFSVFLTKAFGALSDLDGYHDNNYIQSESHCKSYLLAVEADTFWCISRLMNGLQTQVPFTKALHGEAMVARLKEIMTKTDPAIIDLIENRHGLDFVMFAFRWNHCFMGREFSLKNVITLWDYYLADGIEGFSRLQLFVCVALLRELVPLMMQAEDMAEVVQILQKPPLQSWDPVKVQKLVKEAQKIRQEYDTMLI